MLCAAASLPTPAPPPPFSSPPLVCTTDFWCWSRPAAACHLQAALDSSIEELGQSFDVKFFAPLAAGAWLGRGWLGRALPPVIACLAFWWQLLPFVGPLARCIVLCAPRLGRLHPPPAPDHALCMHPPTCRQVRRPAALHARQLGRLRQGRPHQAQGARACARTLPSLPCGFTLWRCNLSVCHCH